jgi:hypothetical protein
VADPWDRRPNEWWLPVVIGETQEPVEEIQQYYQKDAGKWQKQGRHFENNMAVIDT